MKQVRISEAFIFAFGTLKKYPMLLLAPSIILNLFTNGTTLLKRVPALTPLFTNPEKFNYASIESFTKNISPSLMVSLFIGALILLFIAVIIGITLQIGYIRIGIHVFNQQIEEPRWNFYNNFGSGIISTYFGAGLLLGCIILGGLILLVVPAFIFALMYQFTLFILVEKKLSINASLTWSKELTNGIKWQLFGYALLQIFLTILINMPISLLARMPYLYLPLETIVTPIIGMFFTLAGIFIYKDIVSQSESLGEVIPE